MVEYTELEGTQQDIESNSWSLMLLHIMSKKIQDREKFRTELIAQNQKGAS